MKKLFIQGLLATSFALFVTVFVNGQSTTRYRVNIPFDFQDHGVKYSSGEYLIGPLNNVVNNSSLTIQDVKSRRTRLLGFTTRVDNGKIGVGKMIFAKEDGLYTLSEIATPTFVLKLDRSKEKYVTGKIAASKAEAVSITLN